MAEAPEVLVVVDDEADVLDAPEAIPNNILSSLPCVLGGAFAML